MKGKPEAKIERAYTKWLRNIFPFPAIAFKLIIFGRKGFPDRTILCRGRVFFIEFKRPGEKRNPVQKHIGRLLTKLGFNVYECDSLEKAQKATFREFGSTRGTAMESPQVPVKRRNKRA